MHITRNGVTIELTPEEVENIYRTRDEEYTRQELDDRLDKLIDEGDIPEPDEQTREALLNAAIIKMFDMWDGNVCRGDLYWDARADALRAAAEEVIPKLAPAAIELDYTVVFAVNARYEVTVSAASLNEAERKATDAFENADFGELTDTVGWHVDHIEDANGRIHDPSELK